MLIKIIIIRFHFINLLLFFHDPPLENEFILAWIILFGSILEFDALKTQSSELFLRNFAPNI